LKKAQNRGGIWSQSSCRSYVSRIQGQDLSLRFGINNCKAHFCVRDDSGYIYLFPSVCVKVLYVHRCLIFTLADQLGSSEGPRCTGGKWPAMSRHPI
jgi:hypothetical protein